jgi:hypothetical protein
MGQKRTKIIQNSVNYKISSFWDKNYYQMEEMQKRFDVFTMHGTNEDVENQWRLKIKAELEMLSEYKHKKEIH